MHILLSLALASAPPPAEKPVSEDKPLTRIEYRFGDSSVPPPYHRSYTISVSAAGITKVTDSYGDIVGDESFPGSAESLKKAVEAFEAAKLRSEPDTKENRGCTGGTTDVVKAFSGEEQVFGASVYWCGGEGYGELKGDVKAFKAVMNELAKETP